VATDEADVCLTQRGYILSLWGLIYLLYNKGDDYE